MGGKEDREKEQISNGREGQRSGNLRESEVGKETLGVSD